MTTRDDYNLLKTSGLVLIITALVVVALVLGLSGCKAFSAGGLVNDIAHAQTPGFATGAGATLQGPANSAAPSRQVSERRTAYFRPGSDLAGAQYGKAKPQTVKPEAVGAEPSPMTLAPVIEPSLPNEVESQPAWTFERTETTLGEHQSVSAIMQAAAKLDGLNKIQWLGVLCLFFCYSGVLYCSGHNEGYPVICWKVGAIGLALLFCSSPWWALLLVIPALFYVVQKLGLLKLPVL